MAGVLQLRDGIDMSAASSWIWMGEEGGRELVAIQA
jgi:hypothetical protein